MGGGVEAECPQRLSNGEIMATNWEKRGKEKREKMVNEEENVKKWKREGGT